MYCTSISPSSSNQVFGVRMDHVPILYLNIVSRFIDTCKVLEL
jgi:hypothetical protein